MNAVEFVSVSKTYLTKRQLQVGIHDLTFDASEGKVVALVGPNGTGKTTALKLAATLIRATTGTIRVFGDDIAKVGRRIRASIGYVAQKTCVDSFGTVRENLAFQAVIQGVKRSDMNGRVNDSLVEFDLAEQVSTEARHLSGGQRRRLDIAMASIHRPRLLLLDEPTVNLDPDSRLVLWRGLKRKVQEEGLSVLFSTHYLDEADRYADHIVFINNGRTIDAGTPDYLRHKIGDQNALYVFSDGILASTAADELRHLSDYSDFVLAGTSVFVSRVDLQTIDSSLAMLKKKGLNPKSITLSGPTLEDVYLSLTGASFDEENLRGELTQIRRDGLPWLR